MLANKLNNLDSAASSLNFGLGRLTEFVGFNRQGFGKVSITEDLDAVLKLTYQPGYAKGLQINYASGIKKFQIAKVDKGIDLSAQWRKATFGQASLQRHLATFETRLNPSTGAGILALVSFTCGLAGSRSMTTTNALFAMSRTV
jgi:hypothetical protein